MFVVQAIFDFSPAILTAPKEQNQQDKDVAFQNKGNAEDDGPEEKLDEGKRKRSEQHELQLKKEGEDKDYQEEKQQQQDEIHYLTFQKGDKLLVEQALQTGWWYGHLIKKPDQKGFFPSNYVKVGAKPPPPPKRTKKQEEQEEQAEVYDPEQGADWMAKQLQQAQQGQQRPLTSDYYQGITGYKYVKINDNNKNILKGNYVKFDVNTGLARVPVKDQAPTAKAVRQMGYYFDYHQWNQERNKNPEAYKNKPDPNKKNKKKKLHLLGMGKDA